MSKDQKSMVRQAHHERKCGLCKKPILENHLHEDVVMEKNSFRYAFQSWSLGMHTYPP